MSGPEGANFPGSVGDGFDVVPLTMPDGICPGAIDLGQPIDLMLLSRPDNRVVAPVTGAWLLSFARLTSSMIDPTTPDRRVDQPVTTRVPVIEVWISQ